MSEKNRQEVVDILVDTYEYFKERADYDADYDGQPTENEEGKLLQGIGYILHYMGESGYVNDSRDSHDGSFVKGSLGFQKNSPQSNEFSLNEELSRVKEIMRIQNINEQGFYPIEGKLDNEIKINQLEKEILPKKGYKAFFNLPDAGKAANFCDKPNMDGCGAWSKGGKIIIVGGQGYCYINIVPQGQTKNGPFTYDEILNYL